jgi:4'-phosphopantetheinyl transferase
LADSSSHLPLRWTVVSVAAQPEIERGEPPPQLLSDKEAQILSTLRFPLRRRKWLIGRLAAKELIAQELGVRPTAITIGNDPSGAPYAEVHGQGRLVRALSISHRADWGFAGLGEPGVAALGVDIETVEPRTDSFIADFFTADEVEAVRISGAARDLAIARTWSAKEAVLKALGVGLRMDTRAIHIGAAAGDGAAQWFPIEVAVSGDAGFGGAAQAYWRTGPGYVLTAVAVLHGR